MQNKGLVVAVSFCSFFMTAAPAHAAATCETRSDVLSVPLASYCEDKAKELATLLKDKQKKDHDEFESSLKNAITGTIMALSADEKAHGKIAKFNERYKELTPVSLKKNNKVLLDLLNQAGFFENVGTPLAREGGDPLLRLMGLVTTERNMVTDPNVLEFVRLLTTEDRIDISFWKDGEGRLTRQAPQQSSEFAFKNKPVGAVGLSLNEGKNLTWLAVAESEKISSRDYVTKIFKESYPECLETKALERLN